MGYRWSGAKARCGYYGKDSSSYGGDFYQVVEKQRDFDSKKAPFVLSSCA